MQNTQPSMEGKPRKAELIKMLNQIYAERMGMRMCYMNWNLLYTLYSIIKTTTLCQTSSDAARFNLFAHEKLNSTLM